MAASPDENKNEGVLGRLKKAAREVDVRDTAGQLGRALTGTRETAAARRLRGIPRVTFNDVGGLAEAKQELQAVCTALADPERYRRWGTRPPKGVLLYGPPGTGKTLLARCVAGQAKAAFFHVRAVDVASMWYGQAEKRMQEVFDRARRYAPSVIFLDEIDALTPPRERSHEASHRVVSTLLENMDGIRPLEGVIILAATNRPESVDAALLRPGRLDRLVEVPLPDAAARLQILRVHIRRAERRAGRRLFARSEHARFVTQSMGMSGAEIEEVVRRTLEERIRREDEEHPVSEDDLLATLGRFEWGKPGRAHGRGRAHGERAGSGEWRIVTDNS